MPAGSKQEEKRPRFRAQLQGRKAGKTAVFPGQTRRAHRRKNSRVRGSFPRIGLCVYCTTQKSMTAISNMDKRLFALLDTLRDGCRPRKRKAKRRRRSMPSLPFAIVFCTDVSGFLDVRDVRCFDFFILFRCFALHCTAVRTVTPARGSTARGRRNAFLPPPPPNRRGSPPRRKDESGCR